jgi:7-keto-8-aminopelargonate synthetase-like enzyme
MISISQDTFLQDKIDGIGFESQFQLCIMLVTLIGMALALFDESDHKGRGANPISHLSDAFVSTDALFSEGVGLGVLEPLWRIFTLDGVTWTLFRGWAPRDDASALGLFGLFSAICSIISALVYGIIALVCGSWRLCRRRDAKVVAEPESDLPSFKDIKMSSFVKMLAYWGYTRLFVMGVLREYLLRVASVCGDKDAKRYMSREKWSSGWTDFYLQHMYRVIMDCFNRPIASAPDACVDVIKRTRPGGIFWSPLHDFKPTEEVQRCVNLASYNYLGFGGVDEFCTPAAEKAFYDHGFSAGGARTEGGTLPLHRELEREVASYLGKEDALVLGMGFATNSTILPALFEAGGKGILVLSDELNHRSIVEGVRLSGCTVRPFPHNCMRALEAELKKATSEGQPDGKAWRKIFIVVEGIYSMEGDFCRLREIVTLKNRYKAYLYLDEAHSIGAVGPTGRGVTELLGVPTSEVEVMMGTFTKSFGSAGGYVASSQAVIDALRQTAPGSVFASAMSPPCAAQALAALRLISGSIGGNAGAAKLAQIRDNSNFFRDRLEQEGFKVLGDKDSPIIPVMLHHPRKMAMFSRKCLERGIAVVIVGYPAVPVLYERVRFCISASHTREQLSRVMNDVVAIGREIGIMYCKNIGATERTTREVQVKDYNDLLRTAAMQTRTEAQSATEAVANWTPEALAPQSKSSPLALAAKEASRNDERSISKDFRLFDPLGYVAKPLASAQEAAKETLDRYGFGACGPRGFYGSTKPHLQLEATLASRLGTESAIIYSAGVATVSSVLPALVQRGDRVIVDTEVHLGVRAGLRLTRSDISWLPQGDLNALEVALAKGSSSSGSKQDKSKKQQTFVIVEALSQRTGQIAPLAEIVRLKEKYGALLILDESLSFGAYGATGKGVFEESGIDIHRIDAIVGSLEHAVAGVGGFCAGKRGLVEHQRLAGSGYCFSASCPPSACSAIATTVQELDAPSSAERRSDLHRKTERLHAALANAVSECKSFEVVSSPSSYVQHIRWSTKLDKAPLPAEQEHKLVEVAKAFTDECGLKIQVCSPSLCGAEMAFDARIGLPKDQLALPSLRICAATGSDENDIRTLGEHLARCLKAVDTSL